MDIETCLKQHGIPICYRQDEAIKYQNEHTDERLFSFELKHLSDGKCKVMMKSYIFIQADVVLLVHYCQNSISSIQNKLVISTFMKLFKKDIRAVLILT